MPRTRSQVAVLAIILISYFMILLDNSVIFTGLPSIRADLDLSVSDLSWVQDAYVLVFGGLLLLGARAGDLIGRRRLFVVGLVVFGAASLLVGLAPTGWWMIAARALQGVGGAVVAPTSLALITASFEGEARSRAVAWCGATAGIGASPGLLVGGALTTWISWRAAFPVNVPIAIAMVIGARAVLAETPRQRGRFDVIGALCATLGMGGLVFGIIESGAAGWGSARVIGPIVAGLVLLAAGTRSSSSPPGSSCSPCWSRGRCCRRWCAGRGCPRTLTSTPSCGWPSARSSPPRSLPSPTSPTSTPSAARSASSSPVSTPSGCA